MSGWAGYDRWRMGIDDPSMNAPDDCGICECPDRDDPQDDCGCYCHEDPNDWFPEP